MAKRLNKNWLQTYLQYTSNSEAPADFHFWTGVSTIAGALERKVWIQQAYFKWVPNFYITLIAPPGIVQKSTTIGIGMGLLKELEDVHFGPSSTTWQALTDAMGESFKMVEMPQQEGKDFITRDTLPMSALTIPVSEFGTFLDPRNRELVDVLVDLWDSPDGAWKRKTRGLGDSIIENPWLNIISGTTPGWMKENMPEYVISGGFMSRTIMVYADKKRHFRAFTDPKTDKALETLRQSLIVDLQQIHELVGEYELTPEARKWGEEWYEGHWTKPVAVELSNERFGGYRARKQTHIMKLSIVLAASESSELVIHKHHLQAAEKIVTANEPTMVKVFEHIGMKEDTRHVQEIIATVRVVGRISEQDLYRKVYRIMTNDEFLTACEAAERVGFIQRVSDGGGASAFIPTSDREPELEQTNVAEKFH